MGRRSAQSLPWTDRLESRLFIPSAARSDFSGVVLTQGELVVDQDTGEVYIGDGATAGGLLSGTGTAVRYTPQPAPTAKTADATLTIAELLTRIVTATSASAVALTLPTGTLTDAGILAGLLAVDMAFEWTVINLGSSSGAVTMTAGTNHTYVGSATVAIGTSARFRTRKTATNTFITYRVG